MSGKNPQTPVFIVDDDDDNDNNNATDTIVGEKRKSTQENLNANDNSNSTTNLLAVNTPVTNNVRSLLANLAKVSPPAFNNYGASASSSSSNIQIPVSRSTLQNQSSVSNNSSSVTQQQNNSTNKSSNSNTNKKSKSSSSSKTGFALLWICSAGKGQSRQWKQKSLKVMGVFSTKAAAESKKEELMNTYETYGHGDICVGDTWEDEIDLVIRPTELFLSGEDGV